MFFEWSGVTWNENIYKGGRRRLRKWGGRRHFFETANEGFIKKISYKNCEYFKQFHLPNEQYFDSSYNTAHLQVVGSILNNSDTEKLLELLELIFNKLISDKFFLRSLLL